MASGSMVPGNQAQELLKRGGIAVEVIDHYKVSPLNIEETKSKLRGKTSYYT